MKNTQTFALGNGFGVMISWGTKDYLKLHPGVHGLITPFIDEDLHPRLYTVALVAVISPMVAVIEGFQVLTETITAIQA